MVLRKSFYIRWSAGRSPRVHEVNPGRDPSLRSSFYKFQICLLHLGKFQVVYIFFVLRI